MIANYTHDATATSRELVMAAYRLGYEGRADICREDDLTPHVHSMDELLRRLAPHIHENTYRDIRNDFQRFSNACSTDSDEPTSGEAYELLRDFVHHCDDAFPGESPLAEWYHLGSNIGRACHLARKEHTSPLKLWLLRECVELVPDEIRRNQALETVLNAVESETPIAILLELIGNEIPAECCSNFPENELPFHALHKLVSVAIFSSAVEFTGSSTVSQDAWYSEVPPPKALFQNGPVVGYLSQVADAYDGRDPRQLKTLHRSKVIWIHKVNRTEYHVYFRCKSRYDRVAKRMTESSNNTE
jgi:hypothetical protein